MKPNILFFFTDDQRFDTIAALGNRDIKTPNLDKLVSRGTAFTRAHIPGGTCPAVCMPSRAMLHTGRTLFHIEREGQQIPEDHVTMGECFKGAGYETFGCGKWHNGTASFARSFTSGAEIFFGGMFDHWNVPANDFDPTGKYESYIPFVKDPAFSNELQHHRADHFTHGKHSTDLFAEASIEFLQSRAGGNPFFMYVSLMAPHDPRTMPQKFLKMYDPEEIELPANFCEEHAIDTGALRIRDELLAEFPRDPAEIKRHIAEYYAMISHLDDGFGRLWKCLEESGEADNTIVVFAGDNGLAVGQHGLMGKQNAYEHSVRVPLIFAGPGIPCGEQRDQLVYLLDIFPTLCELTGVDTPDSVEGIGLAGAIKDSRAPVRDALYLAYDWSIRGVSNGRYKLVEYAAQHATQLFDLDSDPLELTNLAAESSHSEDLSQMRDQLRELRDRWGDRDHPLGAAFWGERTDLA